MLCKCGCGLTTTKVKRTYNREGIKKGEYRQYVKGHHNKVLKQGYKNGFFISKGYYYIYSPNHPFPTQGNYVKRSRLVMEKIIGRYLKKDEHIHHKNNIRDDDKPENLELTTLSNHNRIHKKAELMINARRAQCLQK